MIYRFATLAGAALGIVAALMGSACSDEDKSLVSTPSFSITKGQLDAKLEGMPQSHQELRSLLQQQLIFQYGKDHNITVSDSEIDAQIQQNILSHMTQDQLNQALAQQGMSQSDLRDLMREQIIVKDAIEAQYPVSQAQMQDYLNKNHALLDQPKQVRARHILVGDLATANMIEAKLKAGADFATLAKEYSTDPGTKDKGGELGFFTQGAMVKEFSDAAFSMKVGQISEPVKSPYGWHIIQVEEIKPAVVATMANSESKIKDQMVNAQLQMRAPAFMDGLMSSSKITINDPQFNDIMPSPAPTLMPTTAPAPATPAPSATK
ncbi:MAG TPA: peptidylprolyl isomerase [Candidatus Eremiobacteraceae bacterium]|nr:peptidylprolyl isomerase [Candidatus Eremiobacteraceae bacterium]